MHTDKEKWGDYKVFLKEFKGSDHKKLGIDIKARMEKRGRCKSQSCCSQ